MENNALNTRRYSPIRDHNMTTIYLEWAICRKIYIDYDVREVLKGNGVINTVI